MNWVNVKICVEVVDGKYNLWIYSKKFPRDFRHFSEGEFGLGKEYFREVCQKLLDEEGEIEK